MTPSLRASRLTVLGLPLLALLALPLAIAAPPTSADLSLAKAGSPDPVVAGSSVVYFLNVSNAGPNNALSVSVVDALPSGFTFVSASTGCAYNSAQNKVTCAYGTVNNGASASKSVTLTAPSTPGNYTNTATVSSSTPDPSSANNNATFTTHVVTGAPQNVICNPTLNGVHAEWDAVTDAVSYNVYRSTNGGGYVFIANTGLTSYEDTSVAAGQTYSYEITAISAGGESPASEPCTSIAVPMFPTTFALVAAIVGSAVVVAVMARRRRG